MLTVTQMLRKKGVVGKFVEFYGPGLDDMTVADRATIGNMAPEYGATCGFFPIDQKTIDYLKITGRTPERVALVEAYAKAQGMWRTADTPDPVFTDTLALDLGDVQPSLAGPKRPQDRVTLVNAKAEFQGAMETSSAKRASWASATRSRAPNFDVGHGDVVIAAITSCTNTSNPSVMIGAGLLARNAVARPENQAVGQNLARAGLAGRGRISTRRPACRPTSTSSASTSSASAARPASATRGRCPIRVPGGQRQRPRGVLGALGQPQLRGPRQPGRASELSRLSAARGRLCARGFDAGRFDQGAARNRRRRKAGVPARHLAIQPGVQEYIERNITGELFKSRYADVFTGDENWKAIGSDRHDLRVGSELDLRPEPALLRGYGASPEGCRGYRRRRAPRPIRRLDHHRPYLAGRQHPRNSPGRQIPPRSRRRVADFNQYGTRRGNHEVMMRGTFAHIRIKNHMVKDDSGNVVEGGYTLHWPDGERQFIYDAAMRYKEEGVPLVVLAGKEYGTGSSRDWAAKGTTCWASAPSSPKASSASTFVVSDSHRLLPPTCTRWVCILMQCAANEPCILALHSRCPHWMARPERFSDPFREDLAIS